MSTFPAYVGIGWTDTADQPAPTVERTEMDRGVAKQRRTQADAVVTVPVTLYFDTAAQASDFESWVYTQANGGAAWFDFTHPRTGLVVPARIVGGDIGALKPSTKTWAYSERTLKLEYLRPTL